MAVLKLLGNFLLPIFSSICFVSFLFLIIIAFWRDYKELNRCKLHYFQEITRKSRYLHAICFIVRKKYLLKGTTDILFRLRGALRDSPMILFRDYGSKIIKSGKQVNIGIELPFEIGDIKKVDIACDASTAKDNQQHLILSDIYIRKLENTAWELHGSNSFENWKKVMLKRKENMNSVFKTWVCYKTVKFFGPGSGVTGIRKKKKGKKVTVMTRAVAKTLDACLQDNHLKKREESGFFALNYLFCLLRRCHEPWSNFSRVNIVIVICLDILAGIATIVILFAFGLDKMLPVKGLHGVLEDLIKVKTDVPGTFDLETLLTDLKDLDKFIQKNLYFLVYSAVVGLTASLIVSIISIFHFRFFRRLGGKNFAPFINDLKKINKKKAKYLQASASAAIIDCTPPKSILVLRTLECRNRHTTSMLVTSRHLRTETMITNCKADDVTTRSIAFIRTKMIQLRNGNLMTGTKNIKSPEVLHESHTQSTDAPRMPAPEVSRSGSQEIVRVARFCERLVQQAKEHVIDNSMIAECFEVAPKSKSKCCEFACCKHKPHHPTADILSDEDTASVNEMSGFTCKDAGDVMKGTDEVNRVPYIRKKPSSESCASSSSEIRRCPAVSSRLQNAMQRNLEVARRTVSKQLAPSKIYQITETPFPSGIPKKVKNLPKKSKKRRFKINRTIALFSLSLLNLSIIFCFSLISGSFNSFFDADAGKSRIYAALLSSLFFLIFYFLFALHLVAFVSMIIELISSCLRPSTPIDVTL